MGFFDFLRKSETADRDLAFDPLKEAEPWFRNNAIDLSSILFGTYDDEDVVEHPGAIVLVGTANNYKNEHLGFAIEIVFGEGVVSELFIEPAAIATKHLFALIEARAKKKSIFDALRYLMKLDMLYRIKCGHDMDGFGGPSKDTLPELPLGQQSENLLLQPGTTAPAIFKGKSVKSCVCEEFVGVVSIDNESVPPIEYPFVLTVFRNGGDFPVLFVTAENNTMSGIMIGHKNGEHDDLVPSGFFLGIFDQHGHHNLGKFEDIISLDGFIERAVPVMKERLGVGVETTVRIEEIS